MMELLSAAFDWADYRDVPISAYRDEYGGWHVRLEFRDARGWFSGTCRVRANESGTAEVTCREAMFADLDIASAQIREDRIRAFNSLPPVVGRNRVGRLNIVGRVPDDPRRKVVHLFQPRPRSANDRVIGAEA